MYQTVADQHDDGEDSSLVRSFTLTKGRTRSAAGFVPVEAAICQRGDWRRGAHKLAPVESEIYRLAGQRLSAAQMSAHLRLPLGVVRVLVGDLVGDGFLLLGPTGPHGDIPLIARLIHGIRAL